mmetsp:Transcript_5785/g.11874  ORF Transcript_5785/g.11874 Transcript_5785/m.11874 type:complete len:131 (+) Transcript_5785:1959-2351(+)
MDLGGDELPDEVLNSRTFDSNVVDTTVKIELEVKQAKKRPFGANDIETMGAIGPIPPVSPILDRQSISVNPPFGLVDGCNSDTTTEPSEVERNSSGLHEGAYCRGKIAMHRNAIWFDLAYIAVGNGVMMA